MDGEEVEIVHECRYLGMTIDSKNSNTDVIYSKGQQRLHFMHKRRQYGVDKSLMTLVYQSFIESALTFCFVARYGSLTVSNTTKLHKIVSVSSRIAGVQLNNMTSLYGTRVLKKGKTI